MDNPPYFTYSYHCIPLLAWVALLGCCTRQYDSIYTSEGRCDRGASGSGSAHAMHWLHVCKKGACQHYWSTHKEYSPNCPKRVTKSSFDQEPVGNAHSLPRGLLFPMALSLHLRCKMVLWIYFAACVDGWEARRLRKQSTMRLLRK